MDATKPTARRVAIAFLLPSSGPGRFILVATIAGIWLSELPTRYTSLTTIVLGAFIGNAAGRMRKQTGASNWPRLAGVAAGLATVVAVNVLGYLATSGSGGVLVPSRPSIVACAAASLLVVAWWLLIGVPQRAHSLGLDQDGSGAAQRVLIKLLTAAAAALTACCVLLLHFADGPLRSVPLGQLLVGALFTVALLAPYYQSLARLAWSRNALTLRQCWQLLREPWQRAMGEARMVIERGTEKSAHRQEPQAPVPPAEGKDASKGERGK